MQEKLPIRKLVNSQLLTSDVLLSVCFKYCQVIEIVERKDHSFPPEDREEDVSEGFAAASSRGTEVFGSEVGLFEKILVLGIFLFEKNFSSLKVQFVPVFAGNIVDEVKNLFDGGFFDGTLFLSIFYFQVKSVDFEFTHVFAERLFEDDKSLF
jgi:hypothetical protein